MIKYIRNIVVWPTAVIACLPFHGHPPEPQKPRPRRLDVPPAAEAVGTGPRASGRGRPPGSPDDLDVLGLLPVDVCGRPHDELARLSLTSDEPRSDLHGRFM